MEKVICSFKLLQGDDVLTTVNIYDEENISKHPVIVDDGIITLKEYVEEKCEHIVTAIHRRLEVTE